MNGATHYNLSRLWVCVVASYLFSQCRVYYYYFITHRSRRASYNRQTIYLVSRFPTGRERCPVKTVPMSATKEYIYYGAVKYCVYKRNNSRSYQTKRREFIRCGKIYFFFWPINNALVRVDITFYHIIFPNSYYVSTAIGFSIFS